ncbi:hypothetical protein HHI36_018737 [Cryptolaemus montrouzieri]|uniref:Hexosyltransferase n=1 Tax=Cryptolaemus montrouzieri TaxID=559131 RepID=A0ABD2P1C3_9CUCU
MILKCNFEIKYGLGIVPIEKVTEFCYLETMISSDRLFRRETRAITELPSYLEENNVKVKDIYISGFSENPPICENDGIDLDLLIVVISAPNNHNKRQAIRQTWGHFTMRREVSIAFFIGNISDNEINNKIEKEQILYEDIIRFNSYNSMNHVLKTVAMLEWVHIFCSEAKFLLKTNDNVFVNVFKLLVLIPRLNQTDRAVYGKLESNWTISGIENSSIFPDFTIGPSYLIPINLCEELFLAALKHSYIRWEDIFLTGLVADALGIKRIHISTFVNLRLPATSCNVQKAISLLVEEDIEQYDLWKVLHDLMPVMVKCDFHEENITFIEMTSTIKKHRLNYLLEDLESTYLK